jgi:ABC-type multidrug transport system fused ATPase/permease subunit
MPATAADIEMGSGERTGYHAVSPQSIDKIAPEERVEIPDTSVLEWTNISYSIASKEKDTPDKAVLQRINGQALPGEMLAIMGTSGAGEAYIYLITSIL